MLVCSKTCSDLVPPKKSGLIPAGTNKYINPDLFSGDIQAKLPTALYYS